MKKQTFAAVLSLIIFSLALTGCGENESSLPGIGEDSVTDITRVSQAPDRLKYVGRDVNFSNVMVQDVVGDYIFWAGERYQALPVVLEREARGETEESEIRIRSGQRLTIEGNVRLVSALSEDSPVWNLIDDQERSEIQSAVVYISAFAVETDEQNAR